MTNAHFVVYAFEPPAQNASCTMWSPPPLPLNLCRADCNKKYATQGVAQCKMRKFATLDCLVDYNCDGVFPSGHIQSLRKAVLYPDPYYHPSIVKELVRQNFQFHRTCSIENLLRDCNVGEGKTLLMYWGCGRSESKATMSMSASSSSSMNTPQPVKEPHNKELRNTAQQTEISCRHTPGLASPAVSAVLPPNGRSMSILGSVCALLLSKQPSTVAPPKEVSSFTGSRHSDNICRICFGGESAERLVRPCSCKGTIAAVHRTCLERWLLQAATSYCELCRHHYVVTRSHKWTWMRSLVEWAKSGRGRALAADAWRGAALGAASVLGTARALHACDHVLQAGARRGGGAALAANLFSSLLIGIIGIFVFGFIGALNGLLTTWMLLKIQEHQMSWQAWRDSTLHVHVTLADEESLTPRPSDTTIVGDDTGVARSDFTDRSTNVADPFMVAIPLSIPEPEF